MYPFKAIYKEAKSYLDADNIPSTETAETEEGYSYFWYDNVEVKQREDRPSNVRINKRTRVIKTKANGYNPIVFKKGDYVDFMDDTVLQIKEAKWDIPDNRKKAVKMWPNSWKIHAIWTLTLE